MGSRFEVAVSCSHGEGLDVWDISNGTHLRSIQQFISSHGSLMSIDDEHIICSMTDKAGLVVVNWKTGQIKSRSFLTERIGAISVSSDCSYMAAAGSTSGKVYIWSVKSGLLLKAWNAHYKCVSCLAFTGDDAALVTGGEDAVLNVWLLADLLKHESIDEFQSPPSPFQQWTDHALPVTDVIVGCGGVRGKIVTCSLDRTVKVWDIASKSMISSFSLPTPLNTVAMDPAEVFICCGGLDGNIYRVNLLTETSLDFGGPPPVATTTSISSSSSSSSSSSLPASSGASAFTSSLFLSELSAESLTQDGFNSTALLVFQGHRKAVTRLSFSFNGSTLCSSSVDGTVRLWDTTSRQQLRVMQKQRTGMGSVIVINDSFGANRKRSSNMQKKAFPLFFRHVYRKPVLDAALWDAASSGMGGLAAMAPHGDEASSVKIVFEHSSGQNNGAFAATTAIGNELKRKRKFGSLSGRDACDDPYSSAGLQPLQMSAHFDNAFISGEELFREHTSLQQALLQRGHPAGSGRAPLTEMISTGTRVRSDIVNKLTAKTADASYSSVDGAFNIEKISTHQTDDEDFIPLTEEGTQETEDARNVYKRQMHGEKGSKKPKPTSHKAGKKR